MAYLKTKNYQTFSIVNEEGLVLSEFEGAAAADRALPGDKMEDGKLLERAEHPPLIGVLELNSKVRYGFTARGHPLYLFKPYDESYPPMLVGSTDTTRENQIWMAAFEAWPADSTFPKGGLVKYMGACGDKEAELSAIAYQASPWSWTNARLPKQLIMPERDGRFVLNKPTINIDPQGCRDIDDLISLWEEDGIWNLAISIADVAAFVALNPELRFAERIGQTLYSEGYAIRPMFPHKFSEGVFSLLPGEERFTVTLFAKWDPVDCVLFDFQFKECIVTNWASYTYENCYSCTELNMGVLKNICSCVGENSQDSHKWIESLMILYNCQAAAVLKEKRAGLLRTHGAPEKEQLIKMECLGLPAKQLAYPAAIYATTQEDTGHWGLATSGPRMRGLQKSCYCHASSPIRRYADILNQEVLKGVLRDEYKKYAVDLNVLDKKAKAYERDRNFIECILGGRPQPIEGVVVDSKRIYIVPWKHMIKSDHGFAEGERVWVGFFPNPAGRSWKRRVVYRVEKI